MSLAAEIEATILQNRPLQIDAPWADEIVFPYYEGLSIRNLAHTAIRLLDGKPPTGRWGQSPLEPRLWEHLWGQAKRVVLFISDGMGWQLLNEVMAEDAATAQVVADLVGEGGSFTPITSIAPSTTAAALPSIWSGSSPAATGLVGTRAFLREFGVMADMLHYRPTNGRFRNEVLEEWGLDFETMVPVQTLGEALEERRIPAYVLLERALFGSGLSRVMHKGNIHAVRHFSFSDLWLSLRDLLHETRGKRCFVSIYWGAVDGISHLHGTVNERSINEIRRQLTELRDLLTQESVSDGRTLFMLAADHGHSAVKERVMLYEHPALSEAWRCMPGGDARLAHLYLRHGFQPQVIDYLQNHLAEQVAVLPAPDALAGGLFGPETPFAETGPRLGDLTVIVREGLILVNQPHPGSGPLSMHGGMSVREMLVPLLMRVM